MDDSDQDFVDLCSKLLKRVRKKPADTRQPKKAEHRASSQAGEGDQTKTNNRRDDDSEARCTTAVSASQAECAGSGSGAAESAGSTHAGLRAKDKVLQRMQQFKRASPQRMTPHQAQQDNHSDGHRDPQRQDNSEFCRTAVHSEPPDSDEALALRLQRELDREVAEARVVDLEDQGLFFCQICHRDLTHMTTEGRTQHINRCLDESEDRAPSPPPPPPPGVPDCPICGKRFKSQKSRSLHLKRCSSDMGVSPAVLLQALQRQAEETQNIPSDHPKTAGTKRKHPPKQGLPVKKKPRKKTEALDENMMVAMALSSSLLEHKEKQREMEAEGDVGKQTATSHITGAPELKWKTDAGRRCGKKKKYGIPRPPPLLLVQDAEVAQMRLQERVSALLLRSCAPSPPTPTRCPSSLPLWSGAAPLWQKSALLEENSSCTSDFYIPELSEFIVPWESVMTKTSFARMDKSDSALQPGSEVTPVSGTTSSMLPSSSQTPCSSLPPTTSGTEQLPVGSQALRDLIELAEDGMTLTQCGYAASGPVKDIQRNSTHLQLSGFVPEDTEEQNDHCVSGFLPETAHTHLENYNQGRSSTNHPGDDKDQGSHRSVALSRLASDLSSMVNNPQLSDVQLQVDSGEVYFAHSFMVYARCPLLAEMVHESGFGVQGEGLPTAQRVLMSDVPGQAVFVLLQYLYTAYCSFPASLRPHVLELASRFDLQELQQLCQLPQEEAAAQEHDTEFTSHEHFLNNQTDQTFLDLLRSMWNDEEQENKGVGTVDGSDGEKESEDHCGGLTSGDREIHEEQVNDEELVEIYEFAATQKKRDEEEDSMEEEKNNEDGNMETAEDQVITKLPKTQPNCQPGPDSSLDRSYNRLFSDSWGVFEEELSALPCTSDQSNRSMPRLQNTHKLSAELSARTVLQSSASVIDKLSPSPPPCTPSMPVPGLSPGPVGDGGSGEVQKQKYCVQPRNENLSLRTESQVSHTVCIPLSPDSPPKKKEPELIVLSDSSEEMEVDHVLSPSPRSPPSTKENTQSYTQIKDQPILKPGKSSSEHKEQGGLEFSPSDKLSASVPGSDCESPQNCSPEVSWLIPSTPVQPGRSVHTSSTQTSSSMCRTQLFPKSETSSHSCSPSFFVSKRIQRPISPVRVSTPTGPTEGSISRPKQDKTLSSVFSLDISVSNKHQSRHYRSQDSKLDSPVFAVPLCQTKVSQHSRSMHHQSHLGSSKLDTPLQIPSYSSTPLHTELQKHPMLLSDSPVQNHSEKQMSAGQETDKRLSQSLEKTELNSFHFSPLSELSSSSHRDPQGLQRCSGCSSKSQCSVEVGSYNNTGNGGDEIRKVRSDEEQIECENKDTDEERHHKTAQSSFQQSFMDEPPIAFNDSWGLNAYENENQGENPGCFSLKLEESGGSIQQEMIPEQRDAARSTIATVCQPVSQSSLYLEAVTPSSPDPTTRLVPNISLLDSKSWDSWEEEEPLSQRVTCPAQHKTPKSSHNAKRHSLVPITPMPHYSDMDTPELKNKLKRFGVRPLPKRQMILKLKEIHQYTHQLVSSDSEDEAPSAGCSGQTKPSLIPSSSRPVSCSQTGRFKEPRAPAATSPMKYNSAKEEAELLSTSQGSRTSSTATSEESERSNPELCLLSDGDSDSEGGISASQAATRLQDRLQAVRSFILSDPVLYSQILQYQPLVLSQFQQQLKAAGIRLGVTKLVDYLDSQCITFTTAKPGHSAPGRRRAKKTGKGAKAAGDSGVSKKRGVKSVNE